MALRSAAHASSAPFSAEERLSEAVVLADFLAGATVQPLREERRRKGSCT